MKKTILLLIIGVISVISFTYAIIGGVSGDADITCNTLSCILSDDTGYRFAALDFSGTNGFDDLIDDVGNTTDIWINETGDMMTGNLNMTGNKLTEVGEIVVTTITLNGNLTASIDGLYNIGNSSNWLANIWVNNVWAESINSTNINTTNLNAKEGNIENITSNEIKVGISKIVNITSDMVVVLQ